MMNRNHQLFDNFRGINWPSSIQISEDSFNKNDLLPLLNNVPELIGIEEVSESELRDNSSTPFFGYRASKDDPQVMSNRGGTDLLFRKDGINLFIENKLIRRGGEECNIKNSFVQAVEYLNLYTVDAAIVMIFDAGRAKDREWEDSPAEHELIQCLTTQYPMCVVRIREKFQTRVYYS